MTARDGVLRRRRLLLGGVGTLALAGCLDDMDDQLPNGDEDDQPPDVAVSSESIDTNSGDCGNPDDETASATRTETGVAVEGTTLAPNPCHIATLQTLLEGTSLSVIIGVEDDGSEVCIECVGKLDYIADIELPDEAVVDTVSIEHEAGEFTDTIEL